MTTLLDRILRRPNNDQENPMATETPETGNVLMRFLTQGGAVVEISNKLAWTCLGCDDGYNSSSLEYARGYANTHAAECRSMPKPKA